MKELHSVVFALGVGTSRVENRKELAEEGGVGLDVVYDFHLVEKDQGIEHRKRRVVQDSRQDHVLQVLQSPGTPDLPANQRILYRNNFLVARLVCEILPMVRFVSGELGIVCDINLALFPRSQNEMSSYIPEPRPPPK